VDIYGDGECPIYKKCLQAMNSKNHCRDINENFNLTSV